MIYNMNNIKVYAFVGPSGTGKSYRAQLVASENEINYIIDDGLLIKDNAVIAGSSAKKAPTKIETVKHALFITEKERDEIRKAIKNNAIFKISKIRVQKSEAGPYIYMEVILNYGFNVIKEIRDFKIKCKKEIERLTTMNVQRIDVLAKGINVQNDIRNK